MVTLISAFRSLGTGISSVFRSGLSKIENLFYRIFSRSTPQTPAPDLRGRVIPDGHKSPLLPKSTNGNPPAVAAAKSAQSPKITIVLSPSTKGKTVPSGNGTTAGLKTQPVSPAKSPIPPKATVATPPNTKITLSPALPTKSSAAPVVISKGAGAGSALATHCPPFRVVGQPKDGNCFFHSLQAGLKHLNHSAKSKTHMELRLDMVRLIQEKKFSLGATLLQEITDLKSNLEDDFQNYKIAESCAKQFGQAIDSKALVQSILTQIPSYIRTFLEIGGISVTPPQTTVQETYEKLISGLEELFNLANATSFNNHKFAPVIRSYLDTISQERCLVNILSAAPLLDELGVGVILHDNSDKFGVLESVGPEGGQKVHLVQAGSHFDLLIPN